MHSWSLNLNSDDAYILESEPDNEREELQASLGGPYWNHGYKGFDIPTSSIYYSILCNMLSQL